MTGNNPSTAIDWIDPDEAPDLSTPEYQAKFAAARVRPGRPSIGKAPKVHIGFRLAADVVESIKASGPGYNVRVEQALREAGFGAAHKASLMESLAMAVGKKPSTAKQAANRQEAKPKRRA
jgi:uncharacterized protein (DUF4415 family)